MADQPTTELSRRLAALGPHRWLILVARFEPLIVLALAPAFWFPRWWSAVLLLVIPALWLVRRVVSGRLSVRTPYDVPGAVIVLTLPLTLIPVVDWGQAVPKFYGLILGLAMVYALANSLTSRARLLQGVYATLLVLGGGIGFAGLIGTEWSVGKAAPIDWVYQHLPPLVSGLTHYGSRGAIHPNEIGGALAMLLPLGLAITLGTWRRDRARGLSGLTVVTAGLGLVSGFMALVLLLTLSRSAFIGCGVGVLLMFSWTLLSVRRSRRGQLLCVVLLALATVTMGVLTVWLASSWMSVTRTGIDSFPTRLELWGRALFMIEDFPLTGIGMGQFPLILWQLYMPLLLSPDVYVPHAHNLFLQIALDLGLIGACAMLWLFVALYQSLWQVYQATADVELRAAAVGLAAGMTGFLVYGLTDAIVIGARGAIGFWVMIGLTAALVRVIRAGQSGCEPACDPGKPPYHRPGMGGDVRRCP